MRCCCEVIFSVGKGTDDNDDNSKLFYFRKAHQRKGGGRGVKFRRTLMTDDFPLLPSSIIIKDDD
jgi:hypothetical protein